MVLRLIGRIWLLEPGSQILRLTEFEIYWSFEDRTANSANSANSAIGVFCQIGFNKLVFTISLSIDFTQMSRSN